MCLLLSLYIQDNPQEGVVISASGDHVTKAVTVVELLKRRVSVIMINHNVNNLRIK